MSSSISEVLLRHKDVLTQILHERITYILGKAFLVWEGMADLPFLNPADCFVWICHPVSCDGNDFLGSSPVSGTDKIFINTGLFPYPGKNIHRANIHTFCSNLQIVIDRICRLTRSCWKNCSILTFLSQKPAGDMFVVSLLRIILCHDFINIHIAIGLNTFHMFCFWLSGSFSWHNDTSFLFGVYIVP